MPTRLSEEVGLALYRPRHVRKALGYETIAKAEAHWAEDDFPGTDDPTLGGKVVIPEEFEKWLRERVTRVRNANRAAALKDKLQAKDDAQRTGHEGVQAVGDAAERAREAIKFLRPDKGGGRRQKGQGVPGPDAGGFVPARDLRVVVGEVEDDEAAS